ncbi:MAG: SPFH domain-containing protein [Candidatus Micrarchaeota archaeon]
MKRQLLIFGLAAAAVLVFLSMVFSADATIGVLLAVFAVVLLVVVFYPNYLELQEYERGVLFTLGKFERVVGPGLVVYFPRVQRVKVIDLRTRVVDIPPESVFTKDQIKLQIDALVYLRVVDPAKAVLKVKDYENAITQLMISEIRKSGGRLTAEEVRAKTEEISEGLTATLSEVARDWGISVFKVTLKSVTMPASLVEAMLKKREAEEYKIRVETEANARKRALEILNEGASKLSDTTLSYLYLNALQKISEGKSTKIIFPMELSRFASTLSKRLRDGGKTIKTADRSELEKLALEVLESRSKEEKNRKS